MNYKILGSKKKKPTEGNYFTRNTELYDFA